MSEAKRVLVGALAGVGLLTAAACGHPTAPAGSGGGRDGGNVYQQAVAFSKCMRSHGDPSFPDPGPGGAFPNNNGSLDRSSTAFKTAQAACKGLAPGSPPQSTFQQDYRQLLKYSACMRAHGMTKFPDPTLEDHGVGFSGDINPNSPQYKTAHQACRSLMPGGGGGS